MTRLLALVLAAALLGFLLVAGPARAGDTPADAPAEASGDNSDANDPLAPIFEVAEVKIVKKDVPEVTGDVDDFYRVHPGPLWYGEAHPDAPAMLIELMSRAALDGLRSGDFVTRKLRGLVAEARSGDPLAIARADKALSESFADYVRALKGADAATGWEINDKEVAPEPKSHAEYLRRAAMAPDLERYILTMGWMQPDYAILRANLQDMVPSEPKARLVRLNMQRLRLIPGADEPGRFVLVNTASQRLAMIEDGRVVDWMKVVVGKPEMPTPMMAAMIRYTALNPYWNLPYDLVEKTISPNIEKWGMEYFHGRGYEALSDWSKTPKTLDPTTIDWAAVSRGDIKVRIRQKPSDWNAMGKMKFMFPNPAGVYLHDTPNKELMTEDARLFSAGCVRLIDASRLGKWMYGEALKSRGDDPEQRVDMPEPIPVYLAYLTTVPSGTQIVYYDDIYSRDQGIQFASR